MPKRILIADDHPIFRKGLRVLIQDSSEFEVVGEAGDGPEALSQILLLRPDIAVLDVAMPRMIGFDVVKEARRQGFDGEFVMLTMYKEEAYYREALDLGVMGYIVKESAASELMSCLRSAVQGKYYLSPALSDYLVRLTMKQDVAGGVPAPINLLTPMERKVLKAIAEGKNSKDIGDDLNISVHTVRNHRAHICAKLGFEGHSTLLQFALEHKSLL